MPRFTEKEKAVRKTIMEPVLAGDPCPPVEEIAKENSLSVQEFADVLKNLEASVCIAVTDDSHAVMETFQDEELDRPTPTQGEIFYARPFATFKNHYPVTIAGKQKWYGECAVESCAISNMFPGKEVVVNSICRQTKEPVELTLRDGEVLSYIPKTLRVHYGFPISHFFDDIIGWCSYNSFFSSEEALEEWRKSHPEVKGITSSPIETANWIHNVVGSRLPYDYQLTMPLLKAMLNHKPYGFTKPLPTLGGLPVPDMFLFNIPGFLVGMWRNGYKQYVRFSLM